MNKQVFEQLHAEGMIGDSSFAKINLKATLNHLSVHWEIKTLLYLGILLLSGGLGILVYKNIDTIGHQAILLFLAGICIGSFYYCFKNKLPFSTAKVNAPNSFFDYLLLLGCCTFITFIGYLQYQYNIFGNRYALAIFFPMVVLFFTAYYFDHIGILCMAITNLGAWLGIAVTPMELLTSNDFNDSALIYTGLSLGLLLLLVAWGTNKRNIKKHFELTYTNFGTHLVLISCLAALFYFGAVYLAWFIVLLGLVYFLYRKSMQDKSFYFILVVTLYAYIGISYVVLNMLAHFGDDGMGIIYLGFLYFIASGIALVLFLVNTNKKLKQHVSI
ncbi:MAG: DUF2157 domain-containing protein [Sediminibacterium sp.]